MNASLVYWALVQAASVGRALVQAFEAVNTPAGFLVLCGLVVLAGAAIEGRYGVVLSLLRVAERMAAREASRKAAREAERKPARKALDPIFIATAT